MTCLILGSEPVADQVLSKKPGFLSACKFKILNSKLFSRNNRYKDHIELVNNLRLADDIYDHVSGSILFSSNYSERATVMRSKQDFDDTVALNISICESVNLMREIVNIQVKEEGVVDTFTRALYNAAVAEKYMVGNCGEMSEVGLKYAYDNQVSARVEVFEIIGEGADHVFIVIGRRRGSNPEDPTTWGDSAVVCDTWTEAKSVYPASELNERLMNYTGTDFRNGRVFTKLEPFDPSKHSLRPYVEYPGR